MLNITEKIQLSAEKIHKIIQDEIAAEVWYESRGCEETLRRCLIEAEKKLITSQKELALLLIEEFEEIIHEKEKKGVNDNYYSVNFKAGMHAMANFILDSAERLKKQL